MGDDIASPAAARAMIPCTLETGGKDAALVLEDADLEDAADAVEGFRILFEHGFGAVGELAEELRGELPVEEGGWRDGDAGAEDGGPL